MSKISQEKIELLEKLSKNHQKFWDIVIHYVIRKTSCLGDQTKILEIVSFGFSEELLPEITSTSRNQLKNVLG